MHTTHTFALRNACYVTAAHLWLRAQDVRARATGDGGSYTTELVIGTVITVGLALTVGTILRPKVIAALNNIMLGG